MATAHIESNKEDISSVVLMPGDPNRAKYIADKYLENKKLVNNVRGMTAYTGYYKGKLVTVFPSGMGIPSMGIYAYELFNFYDVKKIIRIGTSGANRSDIKLLDVILAEESYSLSNFTKLFDGVEINQIESSSFLNKKIEEVAKNSNINLKKGKIITSDIFDVYVSDKDKYLSNYPSDLDTLCSEMESFVLFYLAKKFNRDATTLLTVVDSMYDKREISSHDREQSLDDMIKLALESIL